MAGNKVCLGLLVFFVFEYAAQVQDRYAVYFKYKPQSSLSLSRPQEFLTPKALDRRIREGIKADSLDLPVAVDYLSEVIAFSTDVLYSVKWMNAAVVVSDQAGVDQISALPFVDKVELIGHGFLPRPNERSKLHASKPIQNRDRESKLNARELALADKSYEYQNHLIGIDKMHEEGYTGEGLTVAIFDAGFPGADTVSPLSDLFTNNRIIAQRDLVRPWNPGVFRGHQHGTNVLSLIAANEPAKLVSGAYNSDFILIISEEAETEYPIEEFNWVRAAEYSDSLGVDIINSSLGYWDFDDPAMNYTIEDLDGRTTIISRGASIASDKGILVVNAVGNYGSRGKSSLTAPADVEGVVSVGSVNTDGDVSSFSSRGPTGDGRFKPDLASFGDNPVLIRSNGAVSSSNGTSFAAPQIAALAAGLWEAKPEWTKGELMENLFRSATQFEDPDNLLGYGVPNFYDALYGEVLAVKDEEATEWKVYPNPLIADELNILFGVGLNGTFELIDVTGKTLLRTAVSRSTATLPYRVQLSGIESGLYLIIMQEGSLFRQTKLLRR